MRQPLTGYQSAFRNSGVFCLEYLHMICLISTLNSCILIKRDTALAMDWSNMPMKQQSEWSRRDNETATFQSMQEMRRMMKSPADFLYLEVELSFDQRYQGILLLPRRFNSSTSTADRYYVPTGLWQFRLWVGLSRREICRAREPDLSFDVNPRHLRISVGNKSHML